MDTTNTKTTVPPSEKIACGTKGNTASVETRQSVFKQVGPAMDTINTRAPLSGARFLKSSEVMGLFGYKPNDRAGFWSWVTRSGMPHVRLSARKIVFEEAAVDAWIKRRTVGGVK